MQRDSDPWHQAEASGLAILVALTLFLGTLMVGLPLLHRLVG